MNYKTACDTLEIPFDSFFDVKILKQQYRYHALRYHPDKNHSPDATLKFQEIKQAYDFLLKKLEMDDSMSDDDSFDNDDDDFNMYFSNETDSEYNSILFRYLKHYVKNPLVVAIINKITDICESKAINLLGKIDKVLLVKIHDFMKQYRPIFYVSDSFFEKFEAIIASKMDNDECIILHPLLDDLLEKNLYKMTIETITYVIPLWHHELMYDHSGNDIYFKCYPILPKNISIDHDNHLHVDISYNVADVLDVETVDIEVGKKVLKLNTDRLKIKRQQTIVFKNSGVPRINSNAVYDVSKLADIQCNITINY